MRLKIEENERLAALLTAQRLKPLTEAMLREKRSMSEVAAEWRETYGLWLRWFMELEKAEHAGKDEKP